MVGRMVDLEGACRRVHERAALQPMALAITIPEEARVWAQAGFASIAAFLAVRCPVVPPLVFFLVVFSWLLVFLTG
jgi:hypothetical protein